MKAMQYRTPMEHLCELIREKKQFLSFQNRQEACEFAGGDDYDECLNVYDEEIRAWEDIVNNR